MQHTTQAGELSVREAEIAELREQVATLEELLVVYEQSATEQEQRLEGALHTLQDRAQQLEHAQETLQTLKGILDSMGDAVMVVDEAGRALFLNPAAEQLLEGESSSNSFQHWMKGCEFFHSDGCSPYRPEDFPLSQALKGNAVDAAEIRVVDPQKKRDIWLSINARPIWADADIAGAVAVVRDTTQKKQFERALQRSTRESQQQAELLGETLHQLKQTQAKLIHSEKMTSLGQTVAGIAHEINNPVNFIHGNLRHTSAAFQDLLALIELFQATYPSPTPSLAEAIEAAELEFLAEDIPQMLASMKTGTERIREIVKSLRLFARLDEADVKTVDIHQGLDSALLVLQSRFKPQSKRPAIQLEKVYGELPQIECHAGQLNQVFVHLLSNAIDALERQSDAPRIEISTEASASEVAIKISDNGTGIPLDIQPKIFDPFFTTKPVGKGTGMGLSICYQIINVAHKGSLTCCSAPGEGTQFVIRLPR